MQRKEQIIRLINLKRINKKTIKKEGFTLVELMVVIVIIGTLMGILFAVIGDGNQDEKLAKIAVQQANAALTIKLGDFQAECGRLPSTDEGLRALLEPPADLPCAGKSFLKNDKLLGVRSGCPFKYELVDEANYKIWYLGSDCREGGDGDKADKTFDELLNGPG